jgi:hypothetical protein
VFSAAGRAAATDVVPSDSMMKADKYLPDDTAVVLHINVKQILESPAVKKSGHEEAKKFLKSNEHVSKIFESLGFDPFKDLTGVTIGLSEVAPEPKGLIIAHGKFNKEKFEAKADEIAKEKKDMFKLHTEGGRKILEVNNPETPKPHFVAVIDETTIVASMEKEMVLDACAKAGGKSGKVKDDIRKLIESTDASQSAVALVPGSTLAKLAELVPEDQAKAMISKLDYVSASINLAKDFKMAFNFATKNEDNAKEIAEKIKEQLDQAKGMVALMAGQNPQMAAAVDIVNSVKVTVEGKKISIKMEMSEEQIEKAQQSAKEKDKEKDK